ncbi:hypothetical protein COB72_09320 [bacterium]|nr:MAG: hypothetical protein COB72_09320 [bacterium]
MEARHENCINIPPPDRGFGRGLRCPERFGCPLFEEKTWLENRSIFNHGTEEEDMQEAKTPPTWHPEREEGNGQ